MGKKIEPTDAMVDAVEFTRALMTLDVRGILRFALNHPDAVDLLAAEWKANAEAAAERAERAEEALAERERTNTPDDRPWEPLNGRPLNVGDEVRQDLYGLTITGVVASVNGSGDPWTADGGFIGLLEVGTWYVRRTVQDLPTNPGAVIIPADGHEYIEATMRGETVRAREATRSGAGGWYAAWRSGEQTSGLASSREITPGTWKVDDR